MDKRIDGMNVLMLSWEIFPYSEGGLGRHVYGLSKALPGSNSSGPGIRIFPFCGAAAENIEISTFREGSLQTDTAPDMPDITERLRFTYQAPDLSVLRKVDEANFQALSYAGDAIGSCGKAQDSPNWIIHAHDWHMGRAAAVLKEAYGLPLVATFHTNAVGRRNAAPLMTARIADRESELARCADTVIAVSRALSKEVAATAGIAEAGIKVIPNGIDIAEERASGPGSSGAGSERIPLVLFIGRLVPEKGVDQLLEALSYLRHDGIQFRCCVIGDGPERQQLVRKASELGLAGCVEFKGRVSESEKNRWLQRASAVAVPSVYEPFGIVALEAMAARVPVVVSEVGGLAEIISNGRWGLTFRSGDVISLSFSIGRLLKDRQFADRMAREAYVQIAAKYRWETVAAETLEIYRRLASARRGFAPGNAVISP